MEGQAREHAARDAQPVRAAHRRARDDGARARARSASSPASPTICSASTSRPASSSGRSTSTARSRRPAATATTRSAPADRPRCRRWRRSSPGKYTVYAVSWDGRLRQVNLGRRPGRRAAREVHAGRRQAVRAEPRQRRRSTPRRAQGCGGLTNAFYSFDLATRRASAFIPAGGGLWGRRGAAIVPEGASTSAPATRSSTRRPGASATASSA